MSPLRRAVMSESSRSAAEIDLTRAKARLASSRRRKCAAAAALGSLALASGVAGAIDKPINAHDRMVSVGRLTVRLSGHNRFKLDTCSSNNNLTSEEDAATSISSANNVDESMPPAKMNNYGTNLFLVPADNLPPEFPVAYANGSDDSSSSYGDYDNDSSEEPPQFPGNLADVPAGVFDDDRRLFVNGMAVDRYDFTHNMNAFLPPEEDEGPNPLENIN